MPDPNGVSGSAPDEERDVDTSQADSSTAAGEDVDRDSSTGAESEESFISDAEKHQQGLYDAVRKAADGEDSSEDSDSTEDDEESDKGDSESDDSDKSKEDEEADKDGEQDKDSGEKDDGSDVPEGQRVPYQRFRKVISQRDESRQQLDQLKPAAEQWGQVQQFMQRFELSNDDVAGAFRVLALMKSDPPKAREQLQGLLQQLDQEVGEILPEDLQADVDNGLISEDRAKELARHRKESERSRAKVEQTEAQRERERQEREQAEAVQKQKNAVDRWEAQIRESDPDYPAIQGWVIKELRLQMQNNPPRTADEAVKLANQAYRTVREEVGKLRGRRPEIKPDASTTRSGSSAAASPEPTSILEAARQAAAGNY